MTVEQIIELTMKKHGFNALYNGELPCGCYSGELAPCFGMNNDDIGLCSLAVQGSTIEDGVEENIAYERFDSALRVCVVVNQYLIDNDMFGLVNKDNECCCETFELSDCIQLSCEAIRGKPDVECYK